MHNKSHTQECITACQDCRNECETTLFNHCLEMGEKHVEQSHVRLMADCIEICQTAANAMRRGSENAAAICGTCADICDTCADSCEELGGEEMKHCAEICRSCAETCREMSSSVPGTDGSKERSKSQVESGQH